MYNHYITASPIYARKCERCGHGMAGGFSISIDGSYYCSDDCFYTTIAEEEQPSTCYGFVSYKGTVAGLMAYLEELRKNEAS